MRELDLEESIFGQLCGLSLVKLSNVTLLASNDKLSVERTGGVSVSPKIP